MANVVDFSHNERPIVQYQPLFIVAYSKNSVIGSAPSVTDDDNPHIVESNAQFAQRRIFKDGIALAITRSNTERGKRR